MILGTTFIKTKGKIMTKIIRNIKAMRKKEQRAREHVLNVNYYRSINTYLVMY